MKKIWLILSLLVFTFIVTACSDNNLLSEERKNSKAEAGRKEEGKSFSLVNWNLQTFFDAKKEGLEYSDFQNPEKWNSSKYKERLERLAQAISLLNADIYIFEEIENENVIYDISNQLSAEGHNWNQRKFWNYSVFVKDPLSAIGIGILSRFPLNKIKAHTMDIKLHTSPQPSGRYILEAQVQIADSSVILLANHWKSKSGGEEETEIWRDWQESLLGKRLARLQESDKDKAVIICGDFNRDAGDFILDVSSESNTILRYADFGKSDQIKVKSLWFKDREKSLSEGGSYYYKEEWEKIDNIMICGRIKAESFEALAQEPWADSRGIPLAYKIYSGQGWSDHLPLRAVFSLKD